MSRDTSHPKIGAGHAEAMFRQGLSELRAALYPDGNIAQPVQYGMVGTRTPGEVAQDRRGDTLEEEPGSAIADRIGLHQSAPTPQEPRPPGMERE